MTNEFSYGVAGNDVDQDSGTYSFAAPPGVYIVHLDINDWARQYYDHVTDAQRDQATLVTVKVSEVTSGIDFSMLNQCYVEGTITDLGVTCHGGRPAAGQGRRVGPAAK